MENWRERAKFFLDAAANDPQNSDEYMWYANVAEQYAQQEEARQGASNADVNALIGLGKTAASSAAHWAPMLAIGTGPVGAAVGGIDLLAGHPIGRTVNELLGLPVGEKPTWGETGQEVLTMALLGGQSWPLKVAGGALGLANIVDRGARSQEELANLGVDANILESVAQSVAGPALPGHLTGGDPVGSVVDTMMFTHGATRNPLATKAMRAVSEPADIAAARKTFPWLLGPRAFTEDIGTGGTTYQYGPTEGGIRIDPRLTKQGEYQEAFRETSPGSAVEPKAPSVLGKLVRMARKVYNPEALTLEEMAKFMGDEKGREIKPGAVNTAKSNKIAVWTDYLREKWLRNEPYESVDEKGRTTQRIDPNEHATAESYIEEVLKHEFGHVLRPDVSEYRATRTGQRAADRGAMYGNIYSEGVMRPERTRGLAGKPEAIERPTETGTLAEADRLRAEVDAADAELGRAIDARDDVAAQAARSRGDVAKERYRIALEKYLETIDKGPTAEPPAPIRQKRKGSLDKIVKPKFSTEKDKEEGRRLSIRESIAAERERERADRNKIKDGIYGIIEAARNPRQALAVLFKRLYPDESYRLGEAGEDVTEKLSSRMAEEAPEVLRDKLTPTDVILNSRDLMGKDVRYEEGRLDKMQALIKAGKPAEAMKLSKKLSSTKNYDTLLLRQTQESLRSGDSVHVDMEGKDTWAAVKNWLLPALRESVLDLGQKIYVHAKGTDASLKELQNEIGRLMGADLNEVEVTNKPIPQGAVLASRPVKATEGAARRRTTAEAALASTGLAEERLEAQRGVEAARGKYREAARELRAQKTPAAKRELMGSLSEGRQAVAKRSGVEAIFRKSKDYKPIRGELGQALVGEVESADQMRMIKAGRALYPEAKKEGRRLKILAEAAKHTEVPLEEFGIYKDETGTIIKSKPGKLGLKDAREILQIRDKTAARNFTNELLGKRTVATGESNPVVDAIVRAFGGKELLDNIAKKFNITPETVRAVKAAKTPQERTKAIRSVIDDLEAAHPFLKFSTEKETESKGWLDKIGTFLKERIAGIQRLTDEWLTSSAQGVEDAFQKAIASLPADNKYVKLANRELRNMTAGVGIGQDIRRRVTNFIDRIDLGKKWDALDENSPLLTKEGVSIAEKLPGYEGKYELDAADQAFLKAVRQLNRFIDKINKKVYGRGYKSRKNYITHIMNNIVEKEDVQHLTTGQRKLVGRAYESFLTTGKTPEMKGAPESVKAVAQKYIDAHEYLVGENAPLMGSAEKAIAGVKEILGSQMEKDLDIKLEELGKTLKPSKAGFIQHRVLATHGKYGMQNLKEVVIRQLLAFERTVPDHVTIRSLQRLFDYTKTTTKDGKEITQRPLGEMLLDPQTYNRLKTDYDLAVAERFYPSKYTEVGKTSWASRMMDKFFGTETGLTPFPNQAAAHHLAGIMYQNRLVRPDFYAMNSTDALFKTSFKYNLLSREGLKDFLDITVGLTKRMSANYAASKFLGGKTSPLVKLAVKYAPSRKNLATLLVSGHSETKGLLGKIPGIPTVRKFFNWGSERIEGQEHVNSMMIWAIEAENKLRAVTKDTASVERITSKYGSMIEAYAEGGAGRAEVMKLLDAAGKQPGAKLLKTAFSEAVVEMKRDQGHSGGFFSKSPLGYRLTALGKNHLSIFLQVLGKMYTNYPSTLMTQMIRAMSKSEGLAQTVSPTLGLMALSGMVYGVPVAIANQIEKDPKNRQSAAGLVWGSMWKDMGYPTRLVPLSIAGSIGNILTGRDVKAGAHELASNFMPGYYLGYKTGVWDKIFKENKK